MSQAEETTPKSGDEKTADLKVASVLCYKCEELLDLDSMRGSKRRKKHYESFAALISSANAGCQLCCFITQQIGSRMNPRRQYPFEQVLEAEQDVSIIKWPPQIEHQISRIQVSILDHVIKYSTKGTSIRQVMRFELSVDSNDPLSSIVAGRRIAENASADSAFKVIKDWIHTCQSTHRYCPKLIESLIPSRVVDVGDSGSPKVRLHISDGEKGTWVTLSHCWGSVVPLKCTKSSINQLRKEIVWNQLPLTYQDAIIITRKLGFRYLWIDSLCVLQDSRSDWLRESSRMQEIYGIAALNIAASASSDPNQGIFSSCKGRRLPDQHSIKVAARSSQLALEGLLRIDRPKNRRIEPLSRRAWVVQERALSPRIVHYDHDMLRWSCRSVLSADEGDPTTDTDSGYQHGQTVHNLFKLDTTTALQPFPNHLGSYHRGNSALDWWYRMLKEYFSCQITYASDRLPAVASLARQVALLTGWHYRAGIWEEDILAGLLWTRPSVGEKVLETPSWSWASLNTENLTKDICFPFKRSYDNIDNERVLARLMAIDVENEGQDEYGPAISGSIQICALYRRVSRRDNLLLESGKNFEAYYERHYQAYAKSPPRIVCAMDESICDIEEQLQSLVDREMIYLQIGWRMPYEHREVTADVVSGLVLEPIEGEHRFRRVGVADIPAAIAIEEGWEELTLTII